MNVPVEATVPDDILAAWGRSGASSGPFGTGLINKTFLVVQDGKADLVVQRLHPIFGPKVNDDIETVTAQLEKHGLITPKLVRTEDGRTSVVRSSPGSEGSSVWRALSRVEGGASVNQVHSPAQARAAGALVARFHAAVLDLTYDYQHVRDGVHDTKQHLLRLAESITRHSAHRLRHAVAVLGKEILDAGADLPDLTQLPLRHCHGDLKISNLLFRSLDGTVQQDAEALCLVDLDTLQKLQWPLEMGDALRSWCNPAGENIDEAVINIELFRGAVEGYFTAGRRPFLTREEPLALVDGLFTICVELAARFCRDALEENYFGWDRTRFETRGDHNLMRARGQWSLARSVHERRTELLDIVSSVAR